MPLDETKRRLRDTVRARRRAAHEAGGSAAAQALVAAFERAITVPPDAVVSGYWPAGSELDVRPLLERLHAGGHLLVLPVVTARDASLGFRVWQPGDPLIKSDAPGCRPRVRPDMTPTCCWCRCSASTARAPGSARGPAITTAPCCGCVPTRAVTAIGIGYAVQELPSIPTGPYDQPLDAVLTEAGLIEID
ncbi:MAG: hypothetical protein WDO24_01715 [Pseudomonadota bacterium]